MSGKHGREAYYIAGEGMRRLGADGETEQWTATSIEETVEFRFSRFLPGLVGTANSDDLLAQLAVAMTKSGERGNTDGDVPAGYTYLGQFVDHDMTLDPNELDLRTVELLPLQSLRSPTLDLDSLYGAGPLKDSAFYAPGGVKLLTGRPLPSPTVAGPPSTNSLGEGMDLPRRGAAADGKRGTEREAKIPDIRNDENLVVAQIHAAFIRFHNKVVDDLVLQNTPSTLLFERARETVTKHYQWMLRHDYLPRIAKRAVVEDVYTNGRKLFEAVNPASFATMPVEFSGAVFRLGHSMIRVAYDWNVNFHSGRNGKPKLDSGHLFRLFRFSGTSGTLLPNFSPPDSDDFKPGSAGDLKDLENPRPLPPTGDLGRKLPSNWVADMLRLFDFSRFASSDPAFKAELNHAMAIDTHLVDPLSLLPMGSFGATEIPLLKKRNLAFRNLARGRMLGLPSGQQLAVEFSNRGVPTKLLNKQQLLQGDGGIVIKPADVPAHEELATNTPLWFYILREAECAGNKLDGVGARIVAETFHRAMQSSRYSIVSDPLFKPTLGPGVGGQRFNMEDLLHYAFDGRADLLNPH